MTEKFCASDNHIVVVGRNEIRLEGLNRSNTPKILKQAIERKSEYIGLIIERK
ncbi:hypothetical protein SF1_17140 [Sphingobacterium faecium NBRC 15299]|nr:hypothetical protein SF1_17140 [Sphingobacterium faecium NBRC 15299]